MIVSTPDASTIHGFISVKRGGLSLHTVDRCARSIAKTVVAGLRVTGRHERGEKEIGEHLRR